MRLMECETTLASERDALDVIGRAYAERPDCIVIPLERMAESLLDLKTGLLGAIAQKFVNYGLRAAVVGDISRSTAASKAFADFVRESNRGTQLWFVPDRATLIAALDRGSVSPESARGAR